MINVVHSVEVRLVHTRGFSKCQRPRFGNMLTDLNIVGPFCLKSEKYLEQLQRPDLMRATSATEVLSGFGKHFESSAGAKKTTTCRRRSPATTSSSRTSGVRTGG